MERTIPCLLDSQRTEENRNRLSPQELLAAAAMLVTLKRPTPERARADLAVLDQAVEELFGPGFGVWPEYWEYRAALESFL
jgi:hypothetical protein